MRTLLTTPLLPYFTNHQSSDHIKELSSATPRQPFFFLKPPSSILLPGAGPVLRPRGVTMHYEIELGLIMGKTLRDLHPDDTKGAMDAIEGTFICSEITFTLSAQHSPFLDNTNIASLLSHSTQDTSSPST
jgi:2-keto-4-pentenoate hydratase/2-oxohepta-3-ene-1,7-dioic acid hydratase in catechol pathway